MNVCVLQGEIHGFEKQSLHEIVPTLSAHITSLLLGRAGQLARSVLCPGPQRCLIWALTFTDYVRTSASRAAV